MKIITLAISVFIYVFDTHKLLKPYLTPIKPPTITYEDMRKVDSNVSLLLRPTI